MLQNIIFRKYQQQQQKHLTHFSICCYFRWNFCGTQYACVLRCGVKNQTKLLRLPVRLLGGIYLFTFFKWISKQIGAFAVESELKVEFLNVLDFSYKTNIVHEFNETASKRGLFNMMLIVSD